MVFEITNKDALVSVVSRFLEISGKNKHFAVKGPMGVGKTTFIKEVCRQLNVKEVVTSPTFSLVNEYTTGAGIKVYHFDFYRIKESEELYDIGYEDYVYSDAYCFIEWPERAEELIPSHFKNVVFEELKSGVRKMEYYPE